MSSLLSFFILLLCLLLAFFCTPVKIIIRLLILLIPIKHRMTLKHCLTKMCFSAYYLTVPELSLNNHSPFHSWMFGKEINLHVCFTWTHWHGYWQKDIFGSVYDFAALKSKCSSLWHGKWVHCIEVMAGWDWQQKGKKFSFWMSFRKMKMKIDLAG